MIKTTRTDTIPTPVLRFISPPVLWITVKGHIAIGKEIRRFSSFSRALGACRRNTEALRGVLSVYFDGSGR